MAIGYRATQGWVVMQSQAAQVGSSTKRAGNSTIKVVVIQVQLLQLRKEVWEAAAQQVVTGIHSCQHIQMDVRQPICISCTAAATGSNSSSGNKQRPVIQPGVLSENALAITIDIQRDISVWTCPVPEEKSCPDS